MGYYCKIVHEDSSDYMVATAPVGNIVELYPRNQTEAYISFTYNYATIIDKVLAGGIDGLDGKKVDDTIDEIRSAISKLGDDTDPDHFKPTEGNAKRALQGLVLLAVQCPGGFWRIR